MLSTFAVSIIGWLSVRRIFTTWQARKILSPARILLLQVLSLILCSFPCWIHAPFIVAWLYILALNALVLCVPKMAEYLRRKEFRKNMIPAVDAVLLSVQSGSSYRDSLLELNKKNPHFGFYIHEIISLVLLRQPLTLKTKDMMLIRFFHELNAASMSTHRVSDRIKSFRYVLKIEENFRQKSSMATLQARAQSLVVGILYFLALIFDFGTFSGNLDFKPIVLSVVLFILGVLWIWKLGRTHQWKV
jgi:Flp pilus assembly protein TadB